jgi:hypothetical protein
MRLSQSSMGDGTLLSGCLYGSRGAVAREIVKGTFTGDGLGVGPLTRGSLSCEEMSRSRAVMKE